MADTSTKPTPDQFAPLSLKELAVLLVKHHKLHEGEFEVNFEIGVSIGGFRTSADTVLPGVLNTIGSVGLTQALEPNPNSVNAAEVNPKAAAKKPRGKLQKS